MKTCIHFNVVLTSIYVELDNIRTEFLKFPNRDSFHSLENAEGPVKDCELYSLCHRFSVW